MLQYVMAFEFMRRATEKGYDKFTEMAKQVTDIIQKADTLRDDLNVIFMTHSENKGSDLTPMYKIKTIGKLLDEKITIEGLFDIVLFTHVIEKDAENGEYDYTFLTNTNGACIAKSPKGMFESLNIPNDLQLVLDKIYEYEYGELPPKTDDKKEEEDK